MANGELKEQNIFTVLAARIFNDIYDTLNEKFPGLHIDPFPVVCGTIGIDVNRDRGGSPRSKHLVGEAIDIQFIPNSDENKCVLATMAEYVFIKEEVGSEIAVQWGLGGHVHIAIVHYKGVHKRFPIDNQEAWTSSSKTNVLAVKKAIVKHSQNKIVSNFDNVLKLGHLSGEKYHDELEDITRRVGESLLNDRSDYEADFAAYRMSEVEDKLSNLNTSPVTNWDLHRAIDFAETW